ncbi:MAG: hypothetical protein ACAI38_09000 [Myxococcota bacterium]
MKHCALPLASVAALITACSGSGAGPAAAPAPPDTLAKLRGQLSAAVIASEASCSAGWLSSRTEPPCAAEPRRALVDPQHAWMLENQVVASVAAAAARDASVNGLRSRLTRERLLRDATDAKGVSAVAKALGYPDAPALLSAIHGFDIRSTVASAQELLNASEGLYLVARNDVGASTSEAEGVTKRALPSAKTSDVARALVDAVLPPPSPALSVIIDAPGSSAGVFFVAPSEQRVVAALAGGALDVELTGKALAAGRVRQLLGDADASIPPMLGFVATSPIQTPEWMAATLSLPEPALTQVVRARAFLALEAARAEAARSLDTLALYDGSGTDLGAADPWMTAIVRFRGRLLAANVVSALAQKLGPTWWLRPETPTVLTELLGAGGSDAVLAKLKVGLSPETLLVESARTLARSDALVTRR